MMMKSSILVLVLCLFTKGLFCQVPMSIHQQQSLEYGKMHKGSDKQWDIYNQYAPEKAFKSQVATPCKLNKVVFGWHPYWNGTVYTEYDFSLLSDIAYFSYEVNPTSGSYNNIYSWKTTPMIDMAKAAGTRVSLTVTLFSGHKTFLENSKSRQTLIDSLISLVTFRSAQGVNIDFEAVPSSQRDNLTLFMKELGTRFHSQIPGSIISIALPSVDWGKTFDVVNMLPYVDLFIIMGYDYYYSGSSKAGPVSPKNDGNFWTPYDVTRSVRYYLQTGVPNEKLCLGVPYYGHDWPTNDSTLNSNTSGGGTARLYKDAVSAASVYGRLWDRHASVPYLAYQSGGSWRQCWYDDETSLGFKYDMVNTYNIGGIGIWALGYDRSKQELWTLLREKFSTCGNTLCSGSFTDMGGPEGNYFLGDHYAFTIAQKDTGSISAVFTDFELGSADSLVAYQGLNTQSPIIGEFTASSPPKSVTSKTGAITFSFTSGKTTSGKGWQAYWNCGGALPAEVLTLSQSSIQENFNKGALIGRLMVPDSIVLNKGSLAFVGNDNSDLSYFRISGDSILANTIFNYEKRSKYQVTIEGVDSKGRKVLNSFTVLVLDANDPPVALKGITDQNIRLGEPFTIDLPNPLFIDEDKGDSISLELMQQDATNIPSWMGFNLQTNQITGIPRGMESKTLNFLLSATDRAGAKAMIPFTIVIEKPIGYVDSMASKIMVFPNPSSGNINLLVSSDFHVLPYVDVFDYKGSKIGQVRLTLDALNRQKAKVDLSDFPNGLYFLRFLKGSKVMVEKFMLARPR